MSPESDKAGSFAPAGLHLSEVPLFAARKIGTEVLDIAAATLAGYEYAVSVMLRYFKEDVPVEKITRLQYAAWHEWLTTQPSLSPTTVNDCRARMRAMWGRLKKRDVEVCDISGITEFVDPGPQFSKAVSEYHLTKALQLASPRDTALILYLVNTGCRRQTIPRLRIDNTRIWQAPDGRFRIASKIPQEKTSRSRLLFATHDTAVAVMNWLNVREYQDSPWLFYAHDTGGQLDVESITSAFRDLKKRANLPKHAHFHAHAFRHRFAQNQLDNHDAKVVAQWMGIEVDTLLQVYAHRSEEKLAYKRFGDTDVPADLFR